MFTVVLAEKPAVARDLAEVLGATQKRKGYLEGSGYRVTWALGHLVGLAEPGAMNPAWSRWSYAELPMLPGRWPLVARERVGDQLALVTQLLNARDTSEVVCATDAGREGELIFRYVYEHALCRKPVRRLWVSSLTPEAIRRGFAALQPAADYDTLASAARARSRADWLVGMNLSRAYSLRYDDHLSVGRVQTPTLALVVQRDDEILRFVPEPYHEVHAGFGAQQGEYEGVYVVPRPDERGRVREERKLLGADGAREAQAVLARVSGASEDRIRIAEVERKRRRTPPPALFDLTELQREANRLYGFSAKHTLDVAQDLYEKHKLISYPRTDSRFLSTDVAGGLAPVLAAVGPRYADALAAGSLTRPLGRRFVDDARVTDHHAILPTEARCSLRSESDAFKVYDLVARRLLAAYQPDHVEALTSVLTEVAWPTRAEGDAAAGVAPAQTEGDAAAGAAALGEGATGGVDRFRSRGSSVEQVGFRTLDVHTARARPPKPDLPAGLRVGQAASLRSVRIEDKQTQPPKPHNEATLLTAMETAGRTLDEKAMSDAMRERGLGTPATRAAILETLLERGYLAREGKKLIRATAKGVDLIARVDERVRSAELTGEWELRLARMQRGDEPFERFMEDIEAFVRDVVGHVKESGPPPSRRGVPASSGSAHEPRAQGHAPRGHAGQGASSPARAAPAGEGSVRGGGVAEGLPPVARSTVNRAPTCTPVEARAAVHAPSASAREARGARPPGPPSDGRSLSAWLKDVFGFERFRPHQEDICAAVSGGAHALVVMPTGAGKSLCYQLPGLARGGTTLVVSPLVALIEDQVQKLQRLGLQAERIHAGRGRDQSRAVCREYVEGQLDFLFVAPERLGVRGFPELLAKRPPTLIAIDEAHCISDWGHDFRPDYRMLHERLAALRDVPIVALTATATPRVQADILQQLGLTGAGRAAQTFTFGFRRTNIAVEVVEVSIPERVQRAAALLRGPGRLPAIVYAPTRKACEEQARALGKKLRVGAYHAGLPAPERDAVQAAFQAGELDVVVATIAFGMGIDKANVRTVVHTALPATLEGYYQEIGRAGRDGAPSRAVLMHSFADRRTHEFFLARDYPEARRLNTLFMALSSEPATPDALAVRARLDLDEVERWLSKLWVAGGAVLDEDGGAVRGSAGWMARYEVQRAHKVAQLDAVQGFVASTRCRMLDLVGHFGDRADDGTLCGMCDVCAPGQTALLELSAPTDDERSAMRALVELLLEWNGQATGRLHRELTDRPHGAGIARADVERLLDGLARAGLVRCDDDQFEKDGQVIRFRRAHLLFVGDEAPTEDDLRAVRLVPPRGAAGRARKGARATSKRGRRRSSTGSAAASATGARKGSSAGGVRKGARVTRVSPLAQIDAPAEVVEALRAWRLGVSKQQRVPAFRVLTDRQLGEVAIASPATRADLGAVPGVGEKKLERYADGILRVLKQLSGRS
ncbi:MAG: RecQ family ATP-dependent DNA helicase [Sandaracinaceae bacterium]|nr:RecQ family ATP-dependent DNA helicase [Sandaracinaceae bacterium]